MSRLSWVLTAFVLVACGVIPVGSQSLNQAAPSGTVVYSGTFTGLNGYTVSGTASVYNQGNGTYVLYLNGLSAPSQSNLLIQLAGCGGTPVNSALQGTTGSQDYSFTAACTTFGPATIHSSSLNLDIGQAPLTSTGNNTNTTNTN